MDDSARAGRGQKSSHRATAVRKAGTAGIRGAHKWWALCSLLVFISPGHLHRRCCLIDNAQPAPWRIFPSGAPELGHAIQSGPHAFCFRVVFCFSHAKAASVANGDALACPGHTSANTGFPPLARMPVSQETSWELTSEFFRCPPAR